MNNLRSIYVIWYRDILRFWHDKMRMVGALFSPLLFLFVFGVGLSSRMGMLGGGIDFTQFIYPGIIAMSVFMASFMSGVQVVWDREFGFLKEVLVAPISRASVALGKALGSATTALFQGVIVLILAPLVGVSLSVEKLLLLLPLMFLLAACIGSFAILLASRIKSMEAFQTVTQMLMMPMIFLSGVFFPLEGLPAWMRVLVKINPISYGVAPIRQIVLGETSGSTAIITLFGHTMSIWEDVTVLAAFGVIMIILAMWSFGSQE